MTQGSFTGSSTGSPGAGSPYRAAVVKRRPAPAAPGSAARPARAVRATPTGPSDADRTAEIAAEHARRIASEVTGVRRIEAMTRSWNDELSSTVPAVAAVVSRAVRSIVGEAPREDVVMNALRREVARVRGEHRPVLRVARGEADGWTDRLRERARDAEPAFDVRTDDALATGKCVLEIGARRVELTPEAQLAAFDDHLRNGVGAIAPRPAPDLPDVPDRAATPEAQIVAAQGPAPAPTPAPTPARKRRAGRIAPRTVALGGRGSDAADKGSPGDMNRPAERTEVVESASSTATVQAETGQRESVLSVTPRADAERESEPARKAIPGDAVQKEDASAPVAREGPALKASGDEAAPRVGNGTRPGGASEERDGSARDGDVDLNALDLGEGAARFESRPAADDGGPAPWVGSVVAAPALAKVAIEGGGSRAVAALRDRVARTAGDLREEMVRGGGAIASPEGSREDTTDAPSAETAIRLPATREPRAPDSATPGRDEADAPNGGGRSVPAEGGEGGGQKGGDDANDTLPPFAHRVKARPTPRPAASRDPSTPASTRSQPERSDASAPSAEAGDQRIVADGDGEAIRRVLAGARNRSARAEPDAKSRERRADVPATGTPAERGSRLPPRIAELIAKRRAAP